MGRLYFTTVGECRNGDELTIVLSFLCNSITSLLSTLPNCRSIRNCCR